MIVFDLRCGGGHVFEAWFGSSAAFDKQRAAERIRCPVCDDVRCDKAVMAPAVAAKGNRTGELAPAKAALHAIAAAQARVLEGSKWVGGNFAQHARAMHAGEEAHATIHGQATIAEARALVEEGVPIAPLPLPVVPPKALN